MYNVTINGEVFENIFIPEGNMQLLNKVSTLSDVEEVVFTGCTRYEDFGSGKKIYLSGHPRLPAGLYLAKDCYAYVEMPQYAAIIAERYSPNCGWHPINNDVRGYQLTPNSNGYITFKTKVTRIISDISGRKVQGALPVDLDKLEFRYLRCYGIF